MVFAKILQKLLKQDLALQILSKTEGKNKKVIRVIKDELGRQIMKEFVGLRAKTYSYLKDNNHEEKKEQGT